MIKYVCDICGKQIVGEWFPVIMGVKLQSETVKAGRERELHMHRKCMDEMFEYFAKKAKENES